MWRELGEADFAGLRGLAERVRAVDGGSPWGVSEGFLRGRFLGPDSRTRALVDDDGTVRAAVATRPVDDGRAAVGLVDPAARTGGIGASMVDWALAELGTVRVETESLTDPADALFRSRGLRQTFAEDVLAYDLTRGAPANPADGVELHEWTDALAPRFFAVYTAAFRDRPGFPHPTEAQWVDHDDDFAPEWTVLATAGPIDVGFVTCLKASDAWIDQLGVVPAARGTGLGAALAAEALRRMERAGEAMCFLTVNVNNPGAARVYQRLGFAGIGRRARYQRAA